jgi:photosystem II stability/assembly factor-like uncharacterized protein
MVILALDADPADPNRLWVGYYAPDGIAVSHDGGETWSTGAPGLGDNPVFDLLHLAGDILWAANRDGLIRSNDAGASWSLASDERLPSAAAFALAADASGQIYAGFDGHGLYLRNTDRGMWEPLGNEEKLGTSTVLSLAVSPDGRHIYAGTAGRGLSASQDAGHSWTYAFSDDYVANIAIDPSDPRTAVASLRDRLVRTRDGGDSWETLSIPWARDEIVSLLWMADPTAGHLSQMEATGILLAGSGKGQVYCSQDVGRSWQESGNRVPTQGGVLALTTAGVRLLVGTWTGIYASSPARSAIGPQLAMRQCSDLSPNWTYISPSLGIPHSNALLSTDSRLLIGTRAGLFQWQPTARNWVQVPLEAPLSHDIQSGGVTALATGTSTEQVAYAGTLAGALYRTDSGGTNWVHVPTNLEIGMRALAVSPVDANRLYMLAAWERVYESRDGGKSWKGHWTGLGVTTEAISLAIDPVEPSTIYLGTNSGLFRSRYGGKDWQSVGHLLNGQTVLSLVAHPAPNAEDENSIIYIGATRGAYHSRDGGDTIAPWGQGLEGVSVTAIVFDPNDLRDVYAGTAYAGLFRSVDRGETWRPIGPPKLSEEIVETMSWSPEGELFVASSGGVWVGRRE